MLRKGNAPRESMAVVSAFISTSLYGTNNLAALKASNVSLSWVESLQNLDLK